MQAEEFHLEASGPSESILAFSLVHNRVLLGKYILKVFNLTLSGLGLT